jgi:hypothetical protein
LIPYFFISLSKYAARANCAYSYPTCLFPEARHRRGLVWGKVISNHAVKHFQKPESTSFFLHHFSAYSSRAVENALL